MESRRHHHPQRSRGTRGPPPLPPHHHHQQPRHHRQSPTTLSPAAAASFVHRPRHPIMDDDAISTLMDIDDSPLGAAGGCGFLDEEDGEGEMFLAPHRGGRGGGAGGEVRGPLPFSGFFNSFDGADFDDADLA